ncbi:MAG: UDP-N-acetylmuramoyl-L-alanyl-D-glutamate--2,6-diaminopimelate ligase [Actinobacteria bacterium]|nr:MAG: UDP-N-acetylmuramoyl-L-alanyl-D-glutamate--2,6-diaminopimelate ligase [Actinomycetota bacterium]
MRLAELIESVPPTSGDVWIETVVADSRAARPGALFVARKGTAVDGHAFISKAALAGCAAIVGKDSLPTQTARCLHRDRVPYLRVADPARALGELAARINGDPSRSLTVVGVTGTNGKTTVATLLYQLFSALGESCGLIATTGIRIGKQQHPNTHTTPGPVELQRVLAMMVDAGCRYCFMEVTSHGIDQQRTAGIDFDGGIFTSLDRDHLDYHRTMKAYAEVKQRFFTSLPASAFALANADDPQGRFMLAHTSARSAFYGRTDETLLPWSLERCDEHGMIVRIGNRRVRTRLLGEHNASNLAAATTAASLLGADLGSVFRVIPRLAGARGRMQRVATTPVLAIVDYAHTPESLARVLASARNFRPGGKLIVVGGCGGDRDTGKRAAIGAAIATADIPIFTADNPRSEDPSAISETMLSDLSPTSRKRVQIELDRRRAIQHAVRHAEASDLILLVGKGQEPFQEIAGTKHAWDDVTELLHALRQHPTLRRDSERTRRDASDAPARRHA